jgi:hypothetical protein
MKERISVVSLGVRDLGKSRALYERLGWQDLMRSIEEIVFFPLGGIILSRSAVQVAVVLTPPSSSKEALHGNAPRLHLRSRLGTPDRWTLRLEALGMA